VAAAQPQEAREPSGLYRRPLGHDPATLDPARISDTYSRTVAQQIFDGLVQFDQTLSITPALARYWKASRDGLTWTFQLRRGVKFHHGREVTAEDVVYSLTRLLDPRVKSGAADLFLNIRGAPEYREGKARQVTGLAAVDRYTVRVELLEAPVPFVSQAAVGHARIVPRELAEEQGEAFGTRPVGTGPFRFVRWERGREIALAANPDYFDGPPRIGRLVFRIFPGGQLDAMHEEFRRGGLEDTPVPVKDYRRTISEPGATYVKRPMISLRFYGFNVTAKPLDDPRVRRAIVHAVDRASIVEEVFLGRYTPARGILPPGTLAYNPRLRGHAQDPARARDLLAEAGHPGGRGVPPLAIWSSVKHEGILREHEQIRRDLEAVGLQTEFHYLTDWPAFARGMEEGRFPLLLYAWYADVPDPDNFLFKLFHSRSPRNFWRYRNPVVDELLVQARREPDGQRRVDLYRRAEQIVVDDAPVMPVWHYTYERLFQPYVRSVEVSGLGDPYIPFRKVWLEGRR
jgi:peptide/nickel transport system substrate-binding protein/oligopeptide transport system substrate-binding protein